MKTNPISKSLLASFAIILGVLVSVGIHSAASASTADTVNWNTTYQTIDGFGGENGGPWGSWVVGNTLTTQQADMLFSPSNGIGISIYRTDNENDTNFPRHEAMQAAIARGAVVELSLQSPPSYMKESGSYSDGTQNWSGATSGSCISSNYSYSSYASYVVSILQTLKNNGIPVQSLE